MTVTADDIRKLIRSGESCNLEMKACDASLPRSVWETYSAFDDALISQINSHVNLSVIQRDILRYMIDNPFSTIEEIAVSLCIKPEAVRYQRRLMSEWVRTEKSSSNKSGHWTVVFLG